MTIDMPTLVVIIGMAVITYATRIAGFLLAGRLALEGRNRAAFEAIPVAVLVSLLAPTVLATGPAETIAALAACIAATRLPLLMTILVGVVTVAALRAVLG